MSLDSIYATYVAALVESENKRQSANQVYLSLCIAVVTAATTFEALSLYYASILVMFVSVIWFLSIWRYRVLSRAKFKVVLEMEESLPYPPFKREWEHLHWFPKAVGLTRLELLTPVALFVLGAFYIVWSLTHG